MEQQKKQDVENHSLEFEFIPYKQAMTLKGLGFDEECFGYYSSQQNIVFENGKKNSNLNKPGIHGIYCTAPTFSQVFRWFRDKHKLIGLVEGGYINSKNIFTYVIWDDFIDDLHDDYYEEYEAAELMCLDKLIDTLKAKQI